MEFWNGERRVENAEQIITDEKEKKDQWNEWNVKQIKMTKHKAWNAFPIKSYSGHV